MACPTCETWRRALAVLMLQQGVSRFVIDPLDMAGGLASATMEVEKQVDGTYAVTLTDDAGQVPQ